MRLKTLVLTAARHAGLFSVLRDSAWRRERLLVLCYHGVSLADEHEWNPSLYVSPDFLRARLRRLRDEGYAVLPLPEALERLTAGTLPPRSVAITFDDGAADFALRAVPILEEFRVPATVYVTTYYVDHQLPVFNTMLSYMLWKARASGADLAPVIDAPQPLPVGTPAERAAAWRALKDHTERHELSAVDKDALLTHVAERLGIDYESLRERRFLSLMTPDEVAALPSDLVSVQLHTHRHRSPREDAAFTREIEDNRNALTRMRGPEPFEHFCYPSGDYWREHLTVLERLGVRSATTCVPGIAARDTHPLLVPRFIDTMVVSPLTFDAWCAGVAALLPRKRAYRTDFSRL